MQAARFACIRKLTKSSALFCLASAVAKVERQIEGSNRQLQKAHKSHAAKESICLLQNAPTGCWRTSQRNRRQKLCEKTCSSACSGTIKLHFIKRAMCVSHRRTEDVPTARGVWRLSSVLCRDVGAQSLFPRAPCPLALVYTLDLSGNHRIQKNNHLSSPKPGHTTGRSGRRSAQRTLGRG